MNNIEILLEALVIISEDVNEEKSDINDFLSVAEIANFCKCSERVLSNIFKRYASGFSTLDYITSLKYIKIIEEVKKEPEKGMSDNFYMFYEDYSSFQKQFKKKTAHTPSELKNNLTLCDEIINKLTISISIDGDMRLNNKRLKKIPAVFKQVKGDFIISNNLITSLKGSPIYVGGNFSCENNQLSSLEYAPKTVEGNFNCGNNRVKFTKEQINAHSNIKGEKVFSSADKRMLFNPDLFKDFSLTEITIIELGINNYTINDDGTVDVDGDVILSNLEAYDDKIPVLFNNVSGDFDVSWKGLKTLKGSPKYVGGNFDCSDNLIQSLQFCPETIEGDFICHNNKLLQKIDCFPKSVGKDVNLGYCSIRKLNNLPEEINGDFICWNNLLESDKGAPIVKSGSLLLSDNPFNTTIDFEEPKLNSNLKNAIFHAKISSDNKSTQIHK